MEKHMIEFYLKGETIRYGPFDTRQQAIKWATKLKEATEGKYKRFACFRINSVPPL